MAEAQDSLTDGDLQSEIELVGDLVVAATSSDGPLPQAEIDRLLGVEGVDSPAATHQVEATDEAKTGEAETGDQGEAADEVKGADEVEAAGGQTPEAGR